MQRYSSGRQTQSAKALKANGLPSSNPALSDTALPRRSGLTSATNEINEAIGVSVTHEYGKLPLSFEANDGQIDDAVKFLSRGLGYSLFLTSNEAVLDMTKSDEAKQKQIMERHSAHSWDASSEQAVLRMKLVDANPQARVSGMEEQAGKSNYFIGNDPAKWRTNISHYARVQYRDVYPGVDLIYHGNQRQLEYDFVVAPGANPDVIEFAFDGAIEMELETDGALLLRMVNGEVRQHKPIVYQKVNGERKEIAGHYVIKGKRAVGFEIAEYDLNQPLVIDPVLSYSTYLGGAGADVSYGIVVDSSGNAYVVGATKSVNFPIVNSLPYGDRDGSSEDVFVTKINAAGSALVYSTYLGGTSNREDRGCTIAVDSAGNAYVAGYTTSTDFPRVNALQPAIRDFRDAFVAKLNPTGSALVYSTYLGGSDSNEEIRGIAVDSSGGAYVTGYTRSTDFPLANPLHATHGGGLEDAFVTKLNAAGSALVYSTYLGGNSFDHANSIAVDSAGSAYVTGLTYSNNFPLANPLQATCGCSLGNCGGNGDVFITKFNPAGSALVYSTYLGGNSVEEGQDIAVDSSGNAYITGQTGSTDFPTVNPIQSTLSGGSAFCNSSDAFITKLNPAGSALVYSTYLGGVNGDGGSSIALDSAGSAYVTGRTIANNFPTANPSQPTIGGAEDAFVSKLNPAGSALAFSTYVGGSTTDVGNAIAVDSVGNAYVTGSTNGNFPTEKPFQPIFGGGNFNTNDNVDAFIAKIGDTPLPQASLSISAVTPNRGGNTGSVSVTIHGSGFRSGATVKLVRAGQPDINATTVGVSDDGNVARARFDLTEQSPGVWDVVVSNPGGASISLAGAFTLEAGGRPHIWVDIIGRDEFRPGRPQTYYITYGNRGNLDASLVPLFIAIPKEADYELGFKFIDLPQPVEGKIFDFSQLPAHYNTATEKIIPVFIGFIPAGSSNYLKIRVIGGNNPLRLAARVRVFPRILFSPSAQGKSEGKSSSILQNTDDLAGDGLDSIADGIGCASTIFKGVASCALGFIPGGCELAATTSTIELLGGTATGAAQNYAGGDPNPTLISLTQTAGLFSADMFNCALGELPGVGTAIDVINCGFAANDISNGCFGFDLFGEAAKIIGPLFSIDPNDKIGPTGVGQGRYLSGEEPLRYSIYFENVEAANAPAQDVIISDQLDASKLDFDTFSLGPIGFSKDKQVVPPPGLSEFKKDVDLRPGNNLIVRVEATLDKGTGLLTWRFTSLDPVTMLPTEDPTAGFLPPNMTAPEGEGQVLFTVQPKQGIATGTEIRNHARIVFDTNAPIETPEWVNTIDNTKPTSSIIPLPATQCATDVYLQWSGSDEGSGVSDFTILVSDNNGPIVPLLSNTTVTSTVFQGQVGHTYSFYSIARDNTQNFEEPHSSPDATVSIVSVSPPVITAPPPITVRTGTAATSCGAFISDATLGSAVARSNCLGVTVARDGVPTNHFFPVGNTVITYTATDGAGSISKATQLVTVIDSTPPKVGEVTVDKPSLWPANHKMVDVAIKYDVMDNCGPVTCQINVTSNEPVNGTGDGDSSPDWELVSPHLVQLRAERSGKGNGRVYLIKTICTDGSRNSTSKSVAVIVPHSQK